MSIKVFKVGKNISNILVFLGFMFQKMLGVEKTPNEL